MRTPSGSRNPCGPPVLSSRTVPYPTAVKVRSSSWWEALSWSSSPAVGSWAGVIPAGASSSSTTAMSWVSETPPAPNSGWATGVPAISPPGEAASSS